MVREVVAVHLLHRLERARDRPAERLVAERCLGEQVAGPGARLIVGAPDLLLHDGALAVDLFLFDFGVQHHIGKDVHRERELIERHLVPVAGDFLAGVGVEDAAGPFDRLRDVDGCRPSIRAFEHHVLQVVGEAVGARLLRAGADADKDVHAHGLRCRYGCGHYPQAGLQRFDLPGRGHASSSVRGRTLLIIGASEQPL